MVLTFICFMKNCVIGSKFRAFCVILKSHNQARIMIFYHIPYLFRKTHEKALNQQTKEQKHIKNPDKHLRWIFLQK